VKPWIALFSNTGSELKRICDHFDIWPTSVITNNFNSDDWRHNIPEDIVTMMSPSAIHAGFKHMYKRQFVTLHGYMRILPPEACEMHDVYNGHPGAINLYPELKGKDPQERVWNDLGKYEFIGSVVHKVTEELDGGEIVSKVFCENTCISKEELYNTIRETSFRSWKNFLSTHFERELGVNNV